MMRFEDWQAQALEHQQRPDDLRRCSAPGCHELWPCSYRLRAEAELVVLGDLDVDRQSLSAASAGHSR
jgi:hypothetical protein